MLVRRYLNGELHFCYGGHDLIYTLLPERPKPKTVDKMKNKNRRARASTGPYIPPSNHAWRNFQFGKGRFGFAEPKATSDQKVNSEGFSKRKYAFYARWSKWPKGRRDRRASGCKAQSHTDEGGFVSLQLTG